MFINRESGIRCEHYTSCSYVQQNFYNIEALAQEISLPISEVVEMLPKGRITAYYDHNCQFVGFEWYKEEE